MARLKAQPPKAPVIVAGVTGADPAALELIEAVLGLANGALVLPALDQSLDADSWTAIAPGHPEHPQFGMAELLGKLGIAREQVLPLPGTTPTAAQKARAVADQRGDAAGRHHAALAPVRRRLRAKREMDEAPCPACRSWRRPTARTRRKPLP